MQAATQAQHPNRLPNPAFAEAFARAKDGMLSQSARLLRLLSDAGVIDPDEVARGHAALEIARHGEGERSQRELQVVALRGLGYALASPAPLLHLQAARKHLMDRGEGDPLAGVSARHRDEMARAAWHMRAEAFMLACYARLKGTKAAIELLRELPLMEKANPGLMEHLMQPVRDAAREALSAGVIESCNSREKLAELVTACVAAGVKGSFASDRLKELRAQRHSGQRSGGDTIGEDLEAEDPVYPRQRG